MRQTVIIIDGKACSGKSTTRKWLQALSPLGLIFVGVDLLLDQLRAVFYMQKEGLIPDDLLNFPQYDKYFGETVLDEEGRAILKGGPDCAKYFDARYDLFKIWLEAGQNIVIEEVFFAPEVLNRYLQCIDKDKTDTYLFRLEISPETLRERSINRDGIQAADVDYPGKVFDLVLDSGKMTPKEIAESIVRYIENNPPSAVFDAKNKLCDN